VHLCFFWEQNKKIFCSIVERCQFFLRKGLRIKDLGTITFEKLMDALSSEGMEGGRGFSDLSSWRDRNE
jgi:hypothetical protein